MHLFLKLISLYRDYRTFRQTIKEWLGESGRPVASDVSQSRADMCLDCKFNVKHPPSEIVGAAVIAHLEAKHRMKLSVQGEELLHTCGLCRCHLPLKVHVPIIHIRRHTRQTVLDAIRAGKKECWQLLNHD